MSLGILLVDPQYDFFPGGALGVEGGDEILEPVNALLRRHGGAPVFASRDWHPENSRHFRTRGGPWPPHCVQGTKGAAFHEGLRLPDDVRVYSKGMNPKDDAGYSAFEGVREEVGEQRSLLDDLKALGVDTLLVAGLATDYCVKHSVLDARKNGIEVFVYLPGVRAVNVQPGDEEKALEEMKAAGAFLVSDGG